MAMRSVAAAVPLRLLSPAAAAAPANRRLLSDGGKGRVLSEEERAAENIYIQKMERERLEKLKKKEGEKKPEETGKETPGEADKKPEGSNKE